MIRQPKLGNSRYNTLALNVADQILKVLSRVRKKYPLSNLKKRDKAINVKILVYTLDRGG